MPAILLLAETGNSSVHYIRHWILILPALYIASMVYAQVYSTGAGTETFNQLTGAALFTTLVVTIWTTTLIAYCIYSNSDLTPNQKRNRFHHLLEIIMQSSFTYALALLPNAVTTVIQQQNSDFVKVFTSENYLDAILSGVTVRGTIF